MMRLLTKEDLKKEPNGTLFIPFTPDVFTGELYIITGKDDRGEWNGELPLLPFVIEEDNTNYMTQWCTVDNTWYELKESTKYAVFSKDEIRKMIDCLQWALTECKSYFNQDEWWSERYSYPLSDNDIENDK